MSNALIKYDAARKALAAARTTDEVRQLRTDAAMMRAYAKQIKDRQMEIDAIEIRIRAERRLGELIHSQKETVGLNQGAKAGGKKQSSRGAYVEPRDSRPTLADAGIDKKLSSRAQKLAQIPEKQFETNLSQWRDQSIQEDKKPAALTLLDKKDNGVKSVKSKSRSTVHVMTFSPSVECFLAVESRIMESFDDLDAEGQEDLIGRLKQLTAQLERRGKEIVSA